jgi:isopentenyl-diphosphate delta-isomerase
MDLDDEIVLLDERGHRVGVAPKHLSHHGGTPLHLAFSCYAIDAAGQVLVTRRAAGKKTWPGVWTNSCCGHPLPGESMADAVRRRCRHELGATVRGIDLILPNFRYRAVTPDGVVENEVCPVFRVRLTDAIRLNHLEVDAARWEPWSRWSSEVLQGHRPVSPWCFEQVGELALRGPDPLAWPVAPIAELPAAARGARHSPPAPPSS